VLAEQIEALISQKSQEVLSEALALDDSQLGGLPDMAIPLPVDVSEVNKRRPE
jgi:hypothetical protein